MSRVLGKYSPASLLAIVFQLVCQVLGILTYLAPNPLSCMSYISGHPLLGVLPQMCKPGGYYSVTLKQLFRAAKEDGISYAYMATIPLVYLRDPQLIRDVWVNSTTSLTRFDVDGKGPWGIAHRIAGNVLFTAEGETRQRWHAGFLKTFNNTPSTQRLFPDIVDIASRYVERMRSPGAHDLFRMLEDFALDTAWKATLGIDNISTRYSEVAPAFMEYSDIVGNPDHLWRHYVRNIASGKRFVEPDHVELRVGEGFHRFLEKTLGEHLDKIDPTANSDGMPLNILQQASKESGGTSEAPITPDVMAQARQVLSLAHTPPALLLLWAIYELDLHPDKVQKLRRELAGAKWDKHNFSLTQLNELKYLDAIVNEIMRIHPPISSMARMVTKPIALQTRTGKSFTLQRNTYLAMSIHLLHHDPNVWGDDAGEFVPERWYGLLPKALENRCEYMPFSSGPKRCVASNFVLAQVKTMLAILYSELDIEILDKADVNKNVDAIVTPKKPIWFQGHGVETVV